MQGKQPALKAKLSAYLMSLQKVLPYSQTINVANTTVFGFFWRVCSSPRELRRVSKIGKQQSHSSFH